MFSAALTVIREIIDVYQKKTKKGRKTFKKLRNYGKKESELSRGMC